MRYPSRSLQMSPKQCSPLLKYLWFSKHLLVFYLLNPPQHLGKDCWRKYCPKWQFYRTENWGHRFRKCNRSLRASAKEGTVFIHISNSRVLSGRKYYLLLVILGNCDSLTCIFIQTILLIIISLPASKHGELFILLHLLKKKKKKKGVAQKARQITLNCLSPGKCEKFTSSSPVHS